MASHHAAFLVSPRAWHEGTALRGTQISKAAASHCWHRLACDGQLSALSVTPQYSETASNNWSSALAVAAVTSCVAASAQRQQRGRRSRAMRPSASIVQRACTKVGREDIRNIAIIAHVDHGKTTLTNALMKQCGLVEVVSMDSNQLEQERGITILAKNASVKYKGIKINIVDTPGHADFGGEVERILNMADACLLLVDAQEGAMPQTKFVLRQALKLNKKVIVCINKVDKPASRCDWVLDTTFDLFAAMGADDETCDFPVVYASGFNGVASTDGPDQLAEDLTPLLDTILKETPLAMIDSSAPLQMLVSNLDYDPYVGRIVIGRLSSGTLQVGQKVGLQFGSDGELKTGSVTKLWEFANNEKSPVDEIKAGDLCAFSGIADVTIGYTIVDPENPLPLPPIIVEEPTVAMEFGVNKSPFAARDPDSTKVTVPMIKARLEKECLTNLALRMEPGSTAECFKVKGRGTLQLGILMENMRREGYEFMVGAPQVLLNKDPDTGKLMEPYEECTVEVPSEYQGAIMEEMQKKGGELKNMEAAAVENSMILTFEIPTRNIIGMQGRFMAKTSGSAVMTSQFARWGEYDGKATRLRDKGAIASTASGKASAYALRNFKDRGSFFVGPSDEVYAGMVVGVHNKEEEMTCNIAKEKAVSNVRVTSQTGTADSIGQKITMGIDDFLGFMDTDEVLEVTPNQLRLAKKDKVGISK